jgi:type II secretory pathway pseudopilin PulG
MRRAGLRLMRRAQRALARLPVPARLRSESGFTLIEVLFASVIFIGVATALLGTLTSSIVIHDLSRERTMGQQAATEQIECIRRLAYQDVGLYPSGNPTGRIGDTTVPGRDYCKPSPSTINKTGVVATMNTYVDPVDDPGPTSIATGLNYKKVTVTVTRDSDGVVLASQVTFVAPVQRAPFGGINNSILNVTVLDLALNTAVPSAAVALASGPSAPRSGTTDSAGLISFPGLTPTTTSGATTDYYDIAVTKTGYVTFVSDIAPMLPAHKQVPATLTVPATIRIYKPATINLAVTNGVGGPVYASATTVKITSALTSTTQTYNVTGGSQIVTTFGGQPLRPVVDYTVRGFTATGLCSAAELKNVPDAYPTTLSTSYILPLQPCSTGTLVVNATQLGGPAGGASVTVSGGPNDFAPITQTTNASGQTIFTNLPSGTDTYSISVTDVAGIMTASGAAVIATGLTTTSTIALADPPLGTINSLVQWLGANVNGATVTVTGGPYNITRTLTTPANGQANFSNVPAGSGYTITATKNGQTQTSTSVSVTAGSTTSKTLAMPVANLTVTATWLGTAIGTGTNNVSISGGPDSTNGPYLGSTNGSGVAVVSVPQTTSSFPYNVAVSKYAGSGSSTVTSVPSGGQSTTVTFGQSGTITVTATWLSLFAGNASVSITGGPVGGTYTGTTNGLTGIAPAITVPPTGSGSPTYTVQVTKNAQSNSAAGVNVTNGSNTPSTVNLTQQKTFTITIQRGGSTTGVSGTSINLSITGGPNGTAGAAPAYTFTRTAGAGGVLPTVAVPLGTSGSTYTIKANLTTCGVSAANRSGSIAGQANTGANTNVTINMTTTGCPFSPLP